MGEVTGNKSEGSELSELASCGLPGEAQASTPGPSASCDLDVRRVNTPSPAPPARCRCLVEHHQDPAIFQLGLPQSVVIMPLTQITHFKSGHQRQDQTGGGTPGRTSQEVLLSRSSAISKTPPLPGLRLHQCPGVDIPGGLS